MQPPDASFYTTTAYTTRTIILTILLLYFIQPDATSNTHDRKSRVRAQGQRLSPARSAQIFRGFDKFRVVPLLSVRCRRFSEISVKTFFILNSSLTLQLELGLWSGGRGRLGLQQTPVWYNTHTHTLTDRKHLVVCCCVSNPRHMIPIQSSV